MSKRRTGQHLWVSSVLVPVPDKPAVVPLAEYLKVCDERDTWQRRALDAEARAGTGDVLGEGRFLNPRQKPPGDYRHD